MAEDQPISPAPGTDPEWEKIRKQTPGLNEDPEPEPEAEPEADPEKEPEADPAPEPEAELPADDDEPEVAPEDEEEEKPTRPEKYIPVAQYTDEKRKWRESEGQYKSRIAELEAIAGQDGGKKEDDAIRKYAEKHDLTLEEAAEHVQDIRDVLGIDAPKPADTPSKIEVDPAIQAELEEARQLKAEKAFNDEFETVALPELKALYPDATPAQLAKAKAEIEKLACTAPFLDKSLDFVVFKNKEALKGAFQGKRQGPESTRTAPTKQPAEYSAADFEDNKTSFDVLETLSGDQQSKIIEGMSVKAYDRYTRHLTRNDNPVINRGGRKIKS